MALVAPELVVEWVRIGRTRPWDPGFEVAEDVWLRLRDRFDLVILAGDGMGATGAMRSMSTLGCEEVVALVCDEVGLLLLLRPLFM